MKFEPELFIDIGATSAFFTLRETYLHTIYIPGDGPMGGSVMNGQYQGTVEHEVRSFHHFNLSQNVDEAIAKANEAAERMGLPMISVRADIDFKMRDIKRATAEELQRRAEAYAEQQRIWAEERESKKAERFQRINGGIVSFGKHEGKKIADLPPSFLGWLVKKLPEFDEGSLMQALAIAVRDNYSNLLPPEPNPTLLIGEIGERLTLDVTVLRVFEYERPHPVANWKMQSVYIVTMVTADRACVVSKGTSFVASEGESFRIKGTVKAHEDYKGQAQTILQRIKFVDLEKKAA